MMTMPEHDDSARSLTELGYEHLPRLVADDEYRVSHGSSGQVAHQAAVVGQAERTGLTP